MKIFGIILGLGLLVAVGFFALQYKQPIVAEINQVVLLKNEAVGDARFTSEFFKNISDTVAYDYVSATNAASVITSDITVDDYIRTKARARGYRLRHQADESRLVSLQGQRLQPEAAESLQQLQAAAQEQGLTINFLSGYRSVADQRRIFTNKLGSYDKQKLLAGELDEKLDSILVVSSVPGFSKHHTGYTVDIACNSYELTNAFMETDCYKWLAKDNFKNARAYNFIPSYPVGIENQGPDPESWEFIWVPSDLLK